jgi:hypothetical protein
MQLFAQFIMGRIIVNKFTHQKLAGSNIDAFKK